MSCWLGMKSKSFLMGPNEPYAVWSEGGVAVGEGLGVGLGVRVGAKVGVGDGDAVGVAVGVGGVFTS